ncbi:MAG TPA: biotin/lipoyl-containing protein [Candidatus Acidoferrales bacterium]|nr:biotin/lipoyl-containing protein [Candidatus Acidoferrales bacterium]
MKFSLVVNGREETIELLAPPPGSQFRLGDSPAREAQVEMASRGVYSVLLDGRSYDAFVEEAPAGLIVSLHGFRFEIEVRDPRRYSRAAAGRAGEGAQTLASPMPGKVVRVLAAPGDAVEAGQGILVIEAMKMQNELKASRAGKVLSISAREGATVAAGEPLATVG